MAAWHGVPVVLVTGDDIAVAQVKAIATGAETVTTKRAINLRAVELRPLADVHREIESAAAKAVAAAQRIAPQREATYKVEVQFRDPFIPEVAEVVPGLQRTTPHTVAFTSDAMPKAYALIRFLYRYINPD
jgi:D-amino peptidase